MINWIYLIKNNKPLLVADKSRQADWKDDTNFFIKNEEYLLNSAHIKNRPRNIETAVTKIESLSDLSNLDDAFGFYFKAKETD